ncbi:MAG: DUF975 family protein [Spirochaetaceae bacterium]|nr:DUF975 family protein [Spirochaetaceae bacterium]
MFDRVGFKTAAKGSLKGHWKVPILVILLYIAVAGVFPVFSSVSAEEDVPVYGLIMTFASIAVSGILEIAVIYFFLSFAKNNETKFSYFLDGMNMWLKGILGLLWMTLWVFLWSLLLFIPGIIKSYAYSQTLYVLADNPNISVRKAMNLSKVMTKGYKGDLFVMDLSFIGWSLLCVLTLCIGYLWLIPYIYTTTVNAYNFLKQRALSTGALTEADFN